MNVNKVLTTGYENKRFFRRAENKPNSNPIQTQFSLSLCCATFSPAQAGYSVRIRTVRELVGDLTAGSNLLHSATQPAQKLIKNSPKSSSCILHFALLTYPPSSIAPTHPLTDSPVSYSLFTLHYSRKHPVNRLLFGVLGSPPAPPAERELPAK
jgi:hypothetical protein